MDKNAIISLERKVIFLAWIAKHCFELAFGMAVCMSIILLIVDMPSQLICFAFSVIWTAALIVVILGVNVASILLQVYACNLDLRE